MELQGKKINFLGDSITEGTGASRYEMSYVSQFAAICGADVRNYGIGGTRISRIRHKLSKSPRWDLCFLDRVDEMDKDADVVVVFGGTNDFGHGDGVLGEITEDQDEYTFYGALRSLIRRLMSRFPAARILLMTPLHRKSELVTTNEVGFPTAPLIEYVKAIRLVADEFSLPVLDLWAISGIYPLDEQNCALYTADGLHPNDLGMQRIATLLSSFLKNTL